MLCESAIQDRVKLIQNNEEQVESREKGVGEAYVVLGASGAVVLTVDWIRCSHNTAASVQRCMNPCFCYCDSLLLHNLMDCDSIILQGQTELKYPQHNRITE